MSGMPKSWGASFSTQITSFCVLLLEHIQWLCRQAHKLLTLKIKTLLDLETHSKMSSCKLIASTKIWGDSTNPPLKTFEGCEGIWGDFRGFEACLCLFLLSSAYRKIWASNVILAMMAIIHDVHGRMVRLPDWESPRSLVSWRSNKTMQSPHHGSKLLRPCISVPILRTDGDNQVP